MIDEIIFHTFEFLETGDLKHSDLAKEHLKTLAKKCHVKIKKQNISYSLKDAFRDFILNEKGFNETINKLYNSL